MTPMARNVAKFVGLMVILAVFVWTKYLQFRRRPVAVAFGVFRLLDTLGW
jgi:hypothetical protein